MLCRSDYHITYMLCRSDYHITYMLCRSDYHITYGSIKEATEPRFLFVKLKSSFRTFYGSHHVLINHYDIYKYMCQNDHWYFSFVVIAILSFSHS